jgi:FtsH-binding integral membrane protein
MATIATVTSAFQLPACSFVGLIPLDRRLIANLFFQVPALAVTISAVAVLIFGPTCCR